MELALRRKQAINQKTISNVYVDDVYFCHALEDVVRELPGVRVAEWKVRGETAIPTGRYLITLEDSPSFGPNTLTINDVEGFTHIRMHAGNSEVDTDGCTLLGYKLNADGSIKVGTTKPAVADLKAIVNEAIESGDEVYITVENLFDEDLV
jgi:hypothetical protein